ncbi:MAG: SIMPL domain-containing protein [Pyrinomonadaceae bacterium]
MKQLSVFFLLTFFCLPALAQMSGNQVYDGSEKRAQANTGVLDSSNDKNEYSIEASVLTSVKADEFIAVFGIQEENKTPALNNQKLNAQISAFKADLKPFGIKESDIYVDFITQNRVYDFKVVGNTATEFQNGFETKKTVAVKFKQEELFEKVIETAAKLGIFDLIKVDYLVTNAESYKSKLFAEAVKVIKEKETAYRNSFGVKLFPAGLSREVYGTHYPASRYQRYQAFETGGARTNYNTGNQVLERKSFTFYYVPLESTDFDKSIGEIGIAPVVQFTIYLRMDYNVSEGATK